MSIKAQTLKGFRDFLPTEARRRSYVINKIKGVFEKFGFEPLETPTLEYEEILLGKYGTEGDKLMYRFTDNGERKVAMRYDQTVPLARVVAQYPELPKPFKKYQIQSVFRAENTQKGRYREFLQCDADIVGSSSPLSDAEIIALSANIMSELGFKNFKILINDREIFQNLIQKKIIEEKELISVIRAVDKLNKIGKEGVLDEIIALGFSTERATNVLASIEDLTPTPKLLKIMGNLEKMGVSSENYQFSPTLARGLDYYTGLIFEIEVPEYPSGSTLGGGRYDNLIGMFERDSIPAVGFAVGFDRTLEAMEELDLFPKDLQSSKVLVTVFSQDLLDSSISLVSKLRAQNIPSEIYLDPGAKLEKQLKYADQKGILYVAIIGPDETKSNTFTLKNLKQKSQETLSLDALIEKLSCQ